MIPIVVFTERANLRVKTEQNLVYSKDLNNLILSYKQKILTKDQRDLFFSKILLCDSFLGNLKGKYKIISKQKTKQKREKLGLCPLCGNRLDRRTGPYGDFLGCTNYPACRYRRQLSCN